MRRVAISPCLLAFLSLVACAFSSVQAAEVLVNGDLETGVSPPGWTIDTSITGIPGSEIPQVFEHVDGGNNPPPPSPGLGLLLHPQRGNTGVNEGKDYMINFYLEQTFSAAVAGRTYTFKGDTMLQDGYSGIVDTLEALHPRGDYNNNFVTDAADYSVWRDAMTAGAEELDNRDPIEGGVVNENDFTYWRNHFNDIGHDAIASPTETTFEMAFLNSSNAVLGTQTFDLRDDPTTLEWRTHTLVGVAPTGTTKVRVRVSAENMMDNCCMAGQDVFFDNFSLNDNVATGLNRLTNGNLNTPGQPVGWTVFEGPTVDQGSGPITADTVAFIDFANRQVAGAPNPTPPPDFLSERTGGQGLWLRPFVNETQFEPDLPEVDGYISQVIPASEGADYTFSAWSAWEAGFCGGLPFTTTETFMKMEFLDGSMGVLDTETLDLVTAGQINDDAGNTEYDDWRQFFLNGTAPTGTASVRVSIGATGMFNSGLGLPQSAFFDEMSLLETLPGAGAGNLAAAVPEPSSLLMLVLGLAFALVGIRRRQV